MRSISATAASRGFSELLDAVERGDAVTVTRAGHAVAEVRPASRHTFAELRAALHGESVFDDAMTADIAAATALLADETTDPWADG